MLYVWTSGFAGAQTLEWRRVGNTVVDAGLASPGGGPVQRVWYSPDGSRLHARLTGGNVFETSDFETWTASAAAAPAVSTARVPVDRTRYRGKSILGGDPTDAAVSPRDAAEIVAANASGVWRSLDGGNSWTGLNDTLPNLPGSRILAAGREVRVAVDGRSEIAWFPGIREGWQVRESARPDLWLRARVTARLGTPVSAAGAAGDWVHAGSEDGRLWSSPDQGATWRPPQQLGAGPVTAIFTAASDPRLALAAVGLRIARTVNGGLFWDDLTSNLDAGTIRGISADPATGAVYVAGDRGLFFTYADLKGASPATEWRPVAGALPRAPALDARLDDAGNQLYVLFEGYGVFAAMAPHRFREPRIVSAADRGSGPAAPGALLSILGSRVTSVRAGGLEFPVLDASDSESQVQVPFGAVGTSLSLALTDARANRRELKLSLESTAPSIFLDQDGSPMLVDAERGVLIEPGRPVSAGSRVQILAAGLGKVTPEWPTGLAAPVDNPPKVNAPVRVFVDRSPVKVTRATLAPGFIGFYLIEIELPALVNVGPAELYLEAGGQQSGRVSIPLTQ